VPPSTTMRTGSTRAPAPPPRLVLWAAEGAPDGVLDAARARFHASVGRAIASRGYEAPTGIVMAKLTTSLVRAAAGSAHIERDSNEATWVLLDDLATYDRDSCGGGLFFEAASRDLAADLVALVGIRDQTAGCFGLDTARVRALALTLNGQGVDRWVAIGRALEFGATWDGYDLLAELTRRVTIDVGGPTGRAMGAPAAPDDPTPEPTAHSVTHQEPPA